jgi:hypothetical protein
MKVRTLVPMQVGGGGVLQVTPVQRFWFWHWPALQPFMHGVSIDA